MGGLARDVFGTVELGSPARLTVRGMLVIALDIAVLTGLWWLAALLGGLGPLRISWMPRLRSYEARLGLALAVFFLAPTIGFAAWGVGRAAQRGAGKPGPDDRAIAARRGAAGRVVARRQHGTLARASRPGRAIDAAFMLYRDGEHVAGSTGGLIEALGWSAPSWTPRPIIVSPSTGRRPRPPPGRRARWRAGSDTARLRLTDGAGVLAMSQVAADPVLFDRQRDLALLLILATLAGVAASLVAARVAARVLARPVAELGTRRWPSDGANRPPRPSSGPRSNSPRCSPRSKK
jgi:hypothetical protein